MVPSGREQRRRGKPSRQRINRQQFGVLCPRHVCVPRGHQKHQPQRSTRRQQIEEMERRPQREIKHAAAHRLQRIGEDGKALLPEAFRPQHQRRASHQPRGDPPGRPDPLTVMGQLQREGRPNQQQHDRYAVEDMRAQPLLEGVAGRLRRSRHRLGPRLRDQTLRTRCIGVRTRRNRRRRRRGDWTRAYRCHRSLPFARKLAPKHDQLKL